MSLLEDVFLQDEAGEAQELERVIEGDEYDERPRSRSPDSDENSEKEDEAVEDKRRVDPAAKAKRVVKNPRFILNPARLTGPRGIQILPEHFNDFKFKGKGHEKEDLDFVLKKLEHWAYRLYPKFKFEDCLKKIETLGKKRPVMVHLHKIRSDQFLSEDTVVQKDSSDDEAAAPPQEEDEFDKLLQQQIDLARATPAPASMRKPDFSTPSFIKRSPLIMPRATSSPSISDEQKERMIRNRQLAEERRLARLKQNTSQTIDLTEKTIAEEPFVSIIDSKTAKKTNRSNVIDSSDEDDISSVNLGVTVDIHDTTVKDDVIDVTKLNHDRKNIKNVKSEVTVIDLVDNIIVNKDAHKGKKRNRSNVIDNSDQKCDISTVNKAITIDIYHTAAKNDVIDITELDHDRANGKNVNRETVIDIVDNAIVDKDAHTKVENINRSNVIDSSDEECDISAVNQAITVDIHDTVTKYDVIDITKLNHDRNIIKNTNSQVAVIDLVDRVENEMVNKDDIRVEKHNKSNLIASSDEECDISSVNQAIKVDIHDNHDTVRTNLNVTENDDIEMLADDAEIGVRKNNLEHENKIVDVTENNVEMQGNDNVISGFNAKGNSNVDVVEVSLKNNDIEMQVQQLDTVELNKDRGEGRKEKSIEIDSKDNEKNHRMNDEFDSNIKDNTDKPAMNINGHLEIQLEEGDSTDSYKIKNNQFEPTSLEARNVQGNIEHCTNKIQELNSVEDLMDVDFSDDF